MSAAVIIEAPWREPVEALAPFADEPWALCLLSGGADARWSYLMRRPQTTLILGATDAGDPFEALAALAAPPRPLRPGGPPFQGGAAGLLAYELGDRVERLGLARLEDWPDLACARYERLLAFDHAGRRVLAVGPDQTAARGALDWLDASPGPSLTACGAQLSPDDGGAYEDAVAEVVRRIAAGEIFQANVARRWRARLVQGAHPFGVFARLAHGSAAPFAAYLRLADRALVSNSPERFLRVARAGDALEVETRPIKGTAPRGKDPASDRALAGALGSSAKDRAENLMIVDLMRNDLARVCRPGSVETRELFAIETFANVHHLVSTVTGQLRADMGAADLLRASFPPGSITGAPKVQAMKVIAGLEAPRGPFFGSIVRLGFDGGLDSSVLIRTVAFIQDAGGWRVEARAGAGIVADSDPAAERRETEAKIAALARALEGGG